MTTSFILPAFNLSSYRLRNFNYVLEKARKAFEEVIIVEQVPAINELPPIPGVKHFKIPCTNRQIEKSKLINYAFKKSSGQFLWVNDADIYLPFKKVLSQIEEYMEFIKPFKFFVKLNEEQTNTLIDERILHIDNAPAVNVLVGGAFIIRRDRFESIRGMNEDYTGWGYEDNELGIRVGATCTPVILEEFVGAHLYHVQAFDNDTEYKNKPLFYKGKHELENNVDDYIASINSSI